MKHAKNFLIGACAGALLLARAPAFADDAIANPPVDFRFPAPMMIQANGSEAPVEAPGPNPMLQMLPMETTAFDSDKQRELDLQEERLRDQMRDGQSPVPIPLPADGIPRESFAVQMPPSSESTQVPEADLAPRAPLWVPKIVITPAKRPVGPPPAAGSPSFRFNKEPECQDPVAKAAIETLIERDRKLLIKQARHAEGIRRLRNDQGKHPDSQLLTQLAPYESAYRTRISKGLPKGSIEKRRANLDRAIYNGEAEELLARMQKSTVEARPRAKAAIDKHAKNRKGVDRAKFPQSAIQYLASYHSERVEVESWIQSFDSVCRQMAYLQQAGNRGMASVSKLARTASLR